METQKTGDEILRNIIPTSHTYVLLSTAHAIDTSNNCPELQPCFLVTYVYNKMTVKEL